MTFKVMTAKKTKRKAAPKSIAHHAKRVYHLTPKFVHGMVIGAFAGIVAVMTFGPVLPAKAALTLTSPRDCDTNAVISCGALNTSELKKGYQKTGVKPIYDHFGITADDIKNIDKHVAAGRVYKNGEVRVGNKLVATNAITAGRHNIQGSTKVTSGGVTFYKRATHVSFRVDSIAAFVIMKDGKFSAAILAACGNPVKATAKAVPTPAPPVESPPMVTPAVVTPPTSTQAPESTPTPIVLASSESTLPATGPGDIGLVVCLAVVGGYLYHVGHRHIKHRRRARLG